MPRASSRSSRGRLAELGHRLVEQLGGAVGVGLELAAHEAQVHRQRHQPLLGAVVEVALDPAPLLVARLDDPRPRRAQLLDLGPQLGVELLVLGGEGGADLLGAADPRAQQAEQEGEGEGRRRRRWRRRRRRLRPGRRRDLAEDQLREQDRRRRRRRSATTGVERPPLRRASCGASGGDDQPPSPRSRRSRSGHWTALIASAIPSWPVIRIGFSGQPLQSRCLVGSMKRAQTSCRTVVVK